VGVAEFVHVINNVMLPAVQDVVESNPAVFKPGYKPIWSFDNARHHTSALESGQLAPAGITKRTRARLPPYSSDMHKVVEHAIANTVATFHRKLRASRRVRTMAGYISMLRAAFFEVNTADRINRDVESLMATYRVIAASKANGGVEGGWPPKQYR
jgi:hypothetical protein